MLYGLGTLARDLERARQEQYRNSIRAAGADDQQASAAAAAAKAVKKMPGIGERQPSKDELELALIRCAHSVHLNCSASSSRLLKKYAGAC